MICVFAATLGTWIVTGDVPGLPDAGAAIAFALFILGTALILTLVALGAAVRLGPRQGGSA